ncbi:MAG: L-histidine N(alpha)-methyltransferase [Thermoleophilaceae bacterium]|jgi:L-histidine N-alpha-methyltransferase|nr:L-histidine N(alpha)-methyltransferase [Thermoleophilaceae bacterium]
MHDTLAEPDVQVESFLTGDGLDAMVRDVSEGLRRPLKELPPKYFYDARGSELFDRITQLPAYYPTRCERALLNRHAPEIVRATAAEELVELGSGTASKTRALLYAMVGAGTLRRYVPFDVDETVVERSARELTELYPGLAVHGVVGDFERHLGELPAGDRRLVAFLGGTLGNLHPVERAEFLARIRALLGTESRFLVGVGLVCERATMEAAYDDPEGVTAEFNRNVLRVLNAALGADFDPEAFDHVAFFDPEASWIEMRLRSRRTQRVSIPGAGIDVDLAAGEDIRTEVSAKFTEAGFERELATAGMRLESFMTDTGGRFGLALAAPSYS